MGTKSHIAIERENGDSLKAGNKIIYQRTQLRLDCRL
jgi:hypothetical protein